MDDRLSQLRNQLWEESSERELRIRELEEELYGLELRVYEITQALPPEQRSVVEGYIYAMAELEMYTVTQAFKRGKELGEQIGKNKDMPLYGDKKEPPGKTQCH